MDWVVLGSGTAVPHPSHSSASHLLRGDGVTALFDSGSGTKDRLAQLGVALQTLSHMVYTHAHLDHFSDLLPLLFYRTFAEQTERRPGLTVAGPAAFIDMIHDVCRRIDPDLIARNDDIQWAVVNEQHSLDGGWFAADAFGVAHGSGHAQAYRVRCPSARTLCYSGDTSPCDGILRAARDVDCLICECSLPDGSQSKNHMTPRGVREVADRAGVGAVVLTHLYPEVLATPLPGDAFEGFAGQVRVARDGMRISLSKDQSLFA